MNTNPNEIEAAIERIERWMHCQGAGGSPHLMRLRHEDLRTLISAASARGVADGWQPIGVHCPKCAGDDEDCGVCFGGGRILSPTAATPEVEREAIARVIRDQMREQWDDICADTNCHPLDLKHGRGSVLFYEARHWTDAVADFSADAILALFRTPPAPAGEVERLRVDDIERRTLLEVRTFVIKHGAKQVDAFCAQRLHDICMDARPRAALAQPVQESKA